MERVSLTDVDVKGLVQRLYGLSIISQKKLASTDDVNVLVTVDKACQNNHITEVSENGYVLKILNSIDSAKVDFIGAMHAAIERVSTAGITTSCPVPNVRGQQHSTERLKSVSGKECMFLVRLFQYIPGDILQGKPYTAELCFEVGQLAARLYKALKDLKHPGLDGHFRHWYLGETANLGEKIDSISDNADRNIVRDVVKQFKQNIEGNTDLLRGVIHGDLNEENIIVNGSKDSAQDVEYHVHGVLDFGDLVYGYIVYEISIAMAYMMIETTTLDPIDAAGHTLAGYISEFDLPAADCNALKDCVCARLAQSFTYGSYTHMLDPTNTYCLQSSKKGWPILRALWRIPKQELYEKWANILKTHSLSANFEYT